jgi:hypothetical protein
VISGVTVVTNSRVFYLHARLRAHRAPGIPCALCNKRTRNSGKTRAQSRGEIAKPCLYAAGCLRCEEGKLAPPSLRAKRPRPAHRLCRATSVRWPLTSMRSPTPRLPTPNVRPPGGEPGGWLGTQRTGSNFRTRRGPGVLRASPSQVVGRRVAAGPSGPDQKDHRSLN